ncbi:MAG: hypothetical protein CMJ81_18240 [Planctomycetaceae bacterium]|nr:hypothetical protein [Planctomycetaceae bacterium]MBP61085.1 hypothetical protein [Planctomycetaceae bacterium]
MKLASLGFVGTKFPEFCDPRMIVAVSAVRKMKTKLASYGGVTTFRRTGTSQTTFTVIKVPDQVSIWISRTG